MSSESESSRRVLVGSLYTLAAFLSWGLLPLYWKLLGDVTAPVILAHRIVWSFVFSAGLLMISGRFKPVAFLRDPSRRRVVTVTSVLIAANWFTYIWAVSTEQLLEASMGYYINPLFSVFLGMVVLKERLTRLEAVALLFAVVGVGNIALRYGRVPWIAIMLTLTFGFYGLLKKTVSVDSLTALSLETALLSPVAVAFLVAVERTSLFERIAPGGAFGDGAGEIVALLVVAGVVTALPLYWFAQGAKRIPLSQVGFMQYIAPSLMLLIGVFLFGEAFTVIHALSFGSIWTGLALYSLSRAYIYGRRRNVAETRVSE
ncbi:MAG: EamA family transporter RarD [Spirochaetaceae bacterium]